MKTIHHSRKQPLISDTTSNKPKIDFNLLQLEDKNIVTLYFDLKQMDDEEHRQVVKRTYFQKRCANETEHNGQSKDTANKGGEKDNKEKE